MAKSYVTYEGDGVTTTYAVPFPYLAKLHVFVLIGGERNDDYEWLTQGSIKLNSPTNEIVTITRITPTEPLVDFTDGSVLTENQLDIATIQSLYVAEETQDATKKVFNSLPGDGSDGTPIGDGVNWNAQGLKIINMADGTMPSDAVTKAQLDAAAPNLEGNVNDAQMWAEKAEEEADRAQDIADSLAADVEGANQAADNAKASEIAAKESELAAKDSENKAALSAAEAEASQVAALASENAAAASQVAAKESENKAKQEAANAALSAEFAEDAKLDAQESADDAAASAAAAAASALASANSATDSSNSADKSEGEYLKAKAVVDNFNPALNYIGAIFVTDPAPTGMQPGATYVNEATGVADASFTGIAGETVLIDNLVIYGEDGRWTVSGMSGGLDAYSKGETDSLLATKADKSEMDASQAAQDTKIAANTAKVSNATHTGDVTGSVALTIGNKKVTGAKIADNTINALQINVSGNGGNNQRLVSQGNGSFKWANAAAGGATNVYQAIGAYYTKTDTKRTTPGGTTTFVNVPGTWRVMSIITQDSMIGGVTDYNYLAIRIS